MDQEAVIQLFLVRAVESKHFLAQLLLHVLREVIEESKKILEADQLRKVV